MDQEEEAETLSCVSKSVCVCVWVGMQLSRRGNAVGVRMKVFFGNP